MNPTIRIDDEVYRWLQEQAVPFEDNPNSVLRRIANLDRKQPLQPLGGSEMTVNQQRKVYSGRRKALARGPELIRKWALPVREAHFHRAGTFFGHLSRFPGALCDTNGYRVFDSREEYEKCPELELKKKVNVPEGISSIPGYKTVEESLRITDDQRA